MSEEDLKKMINLFIKLEKRITELEKLLQELIKRVCPHIKDYSGHPILYLDLLRDYNKDLGEKQ